MGGAAAVLLALVGLFLPAAQFAAGWIGGFLLGQLLLCRSSLRAGGMNPSDLEPSRLDDVVYGPVELTEPVLLDLLASKRGPWPIRVIPPRGTLCRKR